MLLVVHALPDYYDEVPAQNNYHGTELIELRMLFLTVTVAITKAIFDKVSHGPLHFAMFIVLTCCIGCASIGTVFFCNEWVFACENVGGISSLILVREHIRACLLSLGKR